MRKFKIEYSDITQKLDLSMKPTFYMNSFFMTTDTNEKIEEFSYKSESIKKLEKKKIIDPEEQHNHVVGVLKNNYHLKEMYKLKLDFHQVIVEDINNAYRPISLFSMKPKEFSKLRKERKKRKLYKLIYTIESILTGKKETLEKIILETEFKKTLKQIEKFYKGDYNIFKFNKFCFYELNPHKQYEEINKEFEKMVEMEFNND